MTVHLCNVHLEPSPAVQLGRNQLLHNTAAQLVPSTAAQLYQEQPSNWYHKQLHRLYQDAVQQPMSQTKQLRPILINRSLIPSLFCALGIVTCLIFLRIRLIRNQALTHAGWYRAALLYVAGTEPCCKTVIDWYQNEQELAGASALLLSCEFGGKNLANYVGKKQSIQYIHVTRECLCTSKSGALFAVRLNVFKISAFVNVCKWFWAVPEF